MDDPHAMPPADEATQQSTSESPQDHRQTGSWWSRWRRRPGYAAAAVIAVVLIAGGVDWWLGSQNYVSTTDAQIDGYITRLAPQVSGRVATLLFTAYQHVTAGEPLLKLDPRDYQVKLQQAQANQASATAQVKQARAQSVEQQATLKQDQANLQAAQAALTQAQQDYQRDKTLRPGVISQQTVDHAVAAFRSAKARQVAAQQAIDSARVASPSPAS